MLTIIKLTHVTINSSNIWDRTDEAALNHIGYPLKLESDASEHEQAGAFANAVAALSAVPLSFTLT